MGFVGNFAVQDVHGRTFGVWTLLTCTLCVFCAFNLDNKPLYQITFLSFVFALGYFLLECFVYHTMAVKNLLSLFFFAGALDSFPYSVVFFLKLFANNNKKQCRSWMIASKQRWFCTIVLFFLSELKCRVSWNLDWLWMRFLNWYKTMLMI